MACVAVASVVRTLEIEFLQPQPGPIVLENEIISSGNKELIESLRGKLEYLMEQLDEKRMDGVEAIKGLEIKLRDVAFRVEDEIEFQVVDLYMKKNHHSLRLGQIFWPPVKKIRPCLRLHHILQQTIEDIDHIQEELGKVMNDYKHVMDQQERKTAPNVLPKPDQTIMIGSSSQHAEDIMVGKNNEFTTIKEMLIEHPSKQREVISIKGMGGIGKTTLARRVYEDPSSASHFDKRAWVVATQHHDKRQMLVGLLNSMGNAETGSDEELALRI